MRGWTLFLVAALCFVPAPARGQDAPRVAVVYVASVDERIPDRLRAELSALGMDVVTVFLAPDEPPATLDAAARRVGAVAGVGVVTATGGIEVWMADRTTRETVLHEFLVGPSRVVDDVVALQAVELLRARLGEVRVAPPPPIAQPVSEPPPTLHAVQHEHRPTLWLELGPGIASGPTGTGMQAHGFVGIRWRAATRFGIDAWSTVPLVQPTIERTEGSADVAPWILGVNAATWLSPPQADWQLIGAAGVAVAHLAISGHAEPPFTDQADSITTALPFIRTSVIRRLGRGLSLGLDGVVGVAAPRPVIRFNGREVAEWGRPVVAAGISCEVALD